MPRVPINLPPGIVSDDTTMATPNRWVDGNNVRFRDGKAQNIGGWSQAVGTVEVNIRNLHVMQDETNTGPIIVMGARTGLFISVDFGAQIDISPSGYATGTNNTTNALDIDARTTTWALSNYGQTLIACCSGKGIYQWSNNTASDAVVVTNAPAKNNYAIALSTRQLMAFGCNEESGGTYNPMCIRFSNAEDITDWTTSADNLAGEFILEGTGLLIAGCEVGGRVAAWTNSGVFIGDNFGTEGWIFKPVAQNCGLIGANAFALVSQTLYWISPSAELWVWPLGAGGIPEIVPCPIRNEFKSNISTANGLYSQGAKIVVSSNSLFQEVRIDYPDARDGAGTENSRYIVFCIGESQKAGYPVWYRGTMARTAAVDSEIFGFPLMAHPNTGSGNGAIYRHESGQTKTEAGTDGSDDWHITTGDFYAEEGRRRVMIRGIWSDFEDQAGSVSMSVFVKDYPQQTATTKGPFTLENDENKSDFRASGKIFAVKFAGSSATDFMRMGRPSLDTVVLGER